MPDNQFSPLDQPQNTSQNSAIKDTDPMVQRILDAAQQCIARYGIRRTSVGEVARVGQLSRGSIYRHFDDKESLVEGVFERSQELFLNRVEAQLEKESNLVDKLTHCVIASRKDMEEGLYARLAETEPETVALMFMDPARYRRSVSFWPPHVHLAMAAGEISPAVDVAVATDLIIRLLVSLTMFPVMGVELKTRRALRDYLQRVLTQGLGQGG